MISVHQFVEGWNYFFHSPEPFTSLGVFRMVWGALLLFNAIIMWPYAIRYFGPAGILTPARHQQIFAKGRFSLFELLPDTNNSVFWLLAAHILTCILVMIGWQTRWSVLLCWLTMLSFHHRNPCVFHSGDTILRLLTFLLIFAPAGERFSVDQLLKERGQPVALQHEQHIDVTNTAARGKLTSAESVPASGSPWALRLMQIQICIIYVRSVFWKLRGKRWWDGTAAYYPTQVDSFNRFPVPKFFLNRFSVASATYGTLVAEAAIGTLIWFDEFRYPMLILGLGLHLGIELLLNLQLFGWTMIVAYLLFIPPRDMERFLSLFY